MLTKNILPVLAAVGYATAQTTCTTTTTVNSAAEATALGSSCKSVKGDVVIGTKAEGIVDLGSLQSISGNLDVENNGVIVTLQGSSLNSIGGDFKLQNVTLISTLAFSSLSSVGSITWRSLPALNQLSLTSGISSAKAVEISDTHLNTLDGLDFVTLSTLLINNNGRLVQWDSKLVNLSDHMNIDANNKDLQVSFPSLQWIANLTVNNVKSFSAPALTTVNGSAKWNNNYFTSFTAPNLTSTKSGDIAFVANEGLTNISFPVLTSIGGGLLVANNTDLPEIDGFSKLQTVGGAIKLRGSFESIAFPALSDVKGAFDASSTEDMQSSCDTLQQLSSTSKSKTGPIQGIFHCTSKNATANSDTGTGTSGTSTGSGSNNTAAGVHVNTALLGLAVVGGFAQLW